MSPANPYFVLESLDASQPRDGWTPLAALTDADVLRGRAERVRAALGPGPLRAAGSVDFLGVSARLISPALEALTVEGAAPVLTLTNVWWRTTSSGPMRVAVGATPRTGSLTDAVLIPVIVPLVAAYAEVFALSRKVLWGNVGSASNGAALGLGRGRPDFRRNTCCLLYRLGGEGLYCGDCVLRLRIKTPDTL